VGRDLPRGTIATSFVGETPMIDGFTILVLFSLFTAAFLLEHRARGAE
jgi:hypothetical protein